MVRGHITVARLELSSNLATVMIPINQEICKRDLQVLFIEASFIFGLIMCKNALP
jgi:hypothetical protein